MENTSLLKLWSLQMNDLNARIQIPIQEDNERLSIANSRGEDFTKIPRVNPIDRANCRDRSNSLFTEILDSYPELSTHMRNEVRKLFAKNSEFWWAIFVPKTQHPELDLRRKLIWYIIRDQSPDPRDTNDEIRIMIDTAESHGVDYRSIIKEVLHLANTEKIWFFPSTKCKLEYYISKNQLS